jgi:hypothetical protein
MAVGQTLEIPSQTSSQYFIPSGFAAPSIGVLNPNDGVAYVARNRQSTNTSVGGWDYKVPSQSYAILPGLVWQSVGVFYLDQSGSNASGEITIYALSQKYEVPLFQAIGRAALVAGTTLDITTGNQPQNPAANSVRLWADGSGNLHVLTGAGTDKTVLDSGNYGTYSIGGDLYGTIGDAHVWAHTEHVQLDRTLNVQWGTNASQDRITVWTDNNMYMDVAAGNLVVRMAGAPVFSTSGGNLVVTNTLQTIAGGINAGAHSVFQGGIDCHGDMRGYNSDIYADRGNGTAVYYFCDQTHYLYWDGTVFTLQGGGLNIGGPIQGNSLSVTGSVSANSVNGGNGVSSSSGAGDFAQWVRSQSGPIYVGGAGVRIGDLGGGQLDYYGPNGSINHRFFHIDGSWCGIQAANFQQQSDIREKYDVQPMSDTDCLSRLRMPNLSVITWQPDYAQTRDVGFAAQDMETVVPEVVTTDDEGNYFLAYPNLAAVLWGALRNVDQRLTALESVGAILPA